LFELVEWVISWITHGSEPRIPSGSQSVTPPSMRRNDDCPATQFACMFEASSIQARSKSTSPEQWSDNQTVE